MRRPGEKNRNIPGDELAECSSKQHVLGCAVGDGAESGLFRQESGVGMGGVEDRGWWWGALGSLPTSA